MILDEVSGELKVKAVQRPMETVYNNHEKEVSLIAIKIQKLVVFESKFKTTERN